MPYLTLNAAGRYTVDPVTRRAQAIFGLDDGAAGLGRRKWRKRFRRRLRPDLASIETVAPPTCPSGFKLAQVGALGQEFT